MKNSTQVLIRVECRTSLRCAQSGREQ